MVVVSHPLLLWNTQRKSKRTRAGFSLTENVRSQLKSINITFNIDGLQKWICFNMSETTRAGRTGTVLEASAAADHPAPPASKELLLPTQGVLSYT